MMPQPSSAGILNDLMDTLVDRKLADPKISYTASLFAAGTDKICDKIAEESDELIKAAAETGPKSRQHQIHETADLIYHVWALLAHQNIPLKDVESEIARRFGTSGLTEKSSRPNPSHKRDDA